MFTDIVFHGFDMLARGSWMGGGAAIAAIGWQTDDPRRGAKKQIPSFARNDKLDHHAKQGAFGWSAGALKAASERRTRRRAAQQCARASRCERSRQHSLE